MLVTNSEFMFSLYNIIIAYLFSKLRELKKDENLQPLYCFNVR